MAPATSDAKRLPSRKSERGEAGIACVKAVTNGVDAESVLECVGMGESMSQAANCARPGGKIGFVGVPHGMTFDGQQLFFQQKSLLGGPAPFAVTCLTS